MSKIIRQGHEDNMFDQLRVRVADCLSHDNFDEWDEAMIFIDKIESAIKNLQNKCVQHEDHGGDYICNQILNMKVK